MLGKLIVGLLFCTSVLAQPIKMVVPFSPGGQVDIITREIEQILQQELKQQVVVEYRVGAGASIGIGSVARTKTNEVVLMVIDANALANVVVSDSIPLSDFKFLSLLGSTSTALAVVKGSPFRDLKYWHTVRRPINVGTNGIGSPHHYYTYSLGKSMGIELEAVPYKGISQSLGDLLNGSIDVMWGSVPSLLEYEKAGKIEMIANVSTRRLSYAPNMPTFTELGYPNAGASTHWMIVANASADPKILKQVQELFAKLVQNTNHPLFTKTHIVPELNKNTQAEQILQRRIEQQREFAEIVKTIKTGK